MSSVSAVEPHLQPYAVYGIKNEPQPQNLQSYAQNRYRINRITATPSVAVGPCGATGEPLDNLLSIHFLIIMLVLIFKK